jgi:hypothetical protein
VGANVPFLTYEAESPECSTNGTKHFLKNPEVWPNTPEREASGGGFVELREAGQFVELTVTKKANGLIIRHCIPDAPAGGGQEATLGLYVNGKRVQSLTLSSKHNWLYGKGTLAENGQRNEPTGFPHVYWDESAYFLVDMLNPGDRVRFQKDAEDSAEYYRIDLVELEEVMPPLQQPANSLSVADYGASSGDADKDTAAITRCIDDAKKQGKIVWLPAGDYLQNARFLLDGVKIMGAGMWYTNLVDAVGDNTTNAWSGTLGFAFVGKSQGNHVSGLKIKGGITTRGSKGAKPFHGHGDDWEVSDVWITHTMTGFWLAGKNGVIRNCRVRFTYADGININNGNELEVNNVLVEHNHVRSVGDDGLAILCHEQSASDGMTSRVTLRNNTVVGTWWGGGCDLAGGTGHVIENNYLSDGGGFVINLPSAYKMRPLTDSVFRGNVLERCGAGFKGGERGAIWIYPGYNSVTDIRIEDNRIVTPWYGGILIAGAKPQEIVFQRNQIVDPSRYGFHITKPVIGKGEWVSNSVTGLKQPENAFINSAGKDYAVKKSDNSWANSKP